MHRTMHATGLWLLLALPTAAHAGQTLSGTYLEASYGSQGLWNWTVPREGLVYTTPAGDTQDLTYPGSPFTDLHVEFMEGSTARYYRSNTYGGTQSWLTLDAQTDASTGTTLTAVHDWTGGNLELRSVESWDVDGSVIGQQFVLHNAGTVDFTDLSLRFGVDPDIDADRFSINATLNDVDDLDGDGTDDWTVSVGPTSGIAMGFAPCDPGSVELGHFTNWAVTTPSTLTDDELARSDSSMNWWAWIGDLPAGDTVIVGSLVVVADDLGTAEALVVSEAALCDLCDADLDGAISLTCGGDDCDDTDPLVHPGATEVCDAGDVDEDCNGVADDDDAGVDTTTFSTWYTDADGDGYGDAAVLSLSCDLGTGQSATGDDCDDTDATVHPDATEGLDDGIDQDCDTKELCYADYDDDGYLDGSTLLSTDLDCTDSGEGVATDPTGDCDNVDATVFPGATELPGDEVDQDCDDTELCYVDADLDGYSDGTTTVLSSDLECTATGELRSTDPSGDCDDTDASVSPAATELVGDERDQDCDGTELCYVDADDDGVTVTDTLVSTDLDCTDAGEGLASDPTDDCDDTAATTYPGAPELPGDEVDQDCDGAELCLVDADNDGHTDGISTVDSLDLDCTDPGEGLAADPVGDCDDGDPAVNPGATEEVGDGLDQDCDGRELCYTDLDGDRYSDGATVWSEDADCADPGELDAGAPRTDCDDTRDDVNPGATEVCGDVDEDCDGLVDDEDDSVDPASQATFYADADGDGFGDPGAAAAACEAPADTVADGTDCDDTDDAVYPGAEDSPDDGIDQDCDGQDTTATADAGDDTGEGATGDGSGSGESDGDKDAGCAHATSPASTLGLALLGLGLLVRRRQSSARGATR